MQQSSPIESREMTPAPGVPWRLRTELARVLVLSALLPALVFGATLLWSQWQRDRGDLLVRLGSNAQLSANAIDEFLQGHLSGVTLLSGSALHDSRPLGLDLQKLLRTYPAMLGAFSTDRDGVIVAAQGEGGPQMMASGQSAAQLQWFQVPRDTGNPYVSNAFRTQEYGNDAMVAVAAPLVLNGAFDGVMQASIPIERFTRLRSDNLRRRGFELLVLDRGNRVVHASQGLRWRVLQATGKRGVQLRQGAAQLGQIREARVMAGLLRGGGGAYVSAVQMRAGWTVAVVAPRERFLSPWLPRLGLLFGLLTITGVGLAMALRRLRQLLAGSMGHLVDSLHGYALGGTLDARQLARMPEELQPLAAGIGDLASRMNAAFDQLRQVLDQQEHVIAARTESLREAVSELDRLSRTDALTGSLNYRGFQDVGRQLWEAARASEAPLAVLALDIDHFKRYNDLYGHAEGDGALRRFAGAVGSALLHADDVLARRGGEEFVVFLPGSTLEQALKVGERVCERVRGADIVHAASPEGRLTVSIGVAAMCAEDAELEQMLARADAAMYRAKTAGRNRSGD